MVFVCFYITCCIKELKITQSNTLTSKQDHFEKWLSVQQFSKHAKATLPAAREERHSASMQLLCHANEAERDDLRNGWRSSSIRAEFSSCLAEQLWIWVRESLFYQDLMSPSWA